MDSNSGSVNVNANGYISINYIIIFLLLIIIVYTFYGLNLFVYISDYFYDVLESLGFYTGSAINETADIVGDTTKTGVSIAQDSIKDVGNLLKSSGKPLPPYPPPPPPPQTQPIQNKEGFYFFNPSPDDCSDPIQSSKFKNPLQQNSNYISLEDYGKMITI